MKVDLRIAEKISWLLSKPKRIKIAVGGRGSSKSIGVGDIMLMCCEQGERICATREFQISIDDSVHESLKQEISRLDVESLFKVTETRIKSSSGGEIFYKGLARNITSLKSLAGVKKLWIEEGESVSKKSLKVLTPSIRSSASDNENEEDMPEIWITMNRGSSSDAIAEKYLKRAEDQLALTGMYEDDMCMIVEVNYRDNPWFPPELEQERLDDLDNLPREEYDHVWEGAYNDTVEGAIIKKAWFDAAIDAHKSDKFKDYLAPYGVRVSSHDPSEGGDAASYVLRHGSIIERVCEREGLEIDEGCGWALGEAIQDGADCFVWDGDGMGAGLKAQVSRALSGKGIQSHLYKGSLAGKAQDGAESLYMPTTKDKEDRPKKKLKNKDVYKNNRAKYSFELADRFYNTYRAVVKGEYVDPDDMISINSDGVENMVKFRSEVCRIPKKENSNGLKQVLSKEEMKKMEINSPNMFDGVKMTYANPSVIERKEFKPMRRKF